MTKSALIVWGGWDGHTPEQSSRFVAGMLEGHGFTVDIEPTTEAFADEGLAGYDLIVPVITMSRRWLRSSVQNVISRWLWCSA